MVSVAEAGAAELEEADNKIITRPIKIKLNLKDKSLTNEVPGIQMGPQIVVAAAIGPKGRGRLTVPTRWSVDGPISSLPDLKIIIEKLARLEKIKLTFKTYYMEA